MKVIITLFSAFLLCSCASKQEKEFRKTYINEVKLKYFSGCLRYGYNDSKEIRKVLQSDHSGYSELILGTRYFYIDSLAKKAGERMKLDSINRRGRVAEGADGKQILSTCLCDYESKWLDSLARQEYKRYQQQEKKYKID